MDDTEILKLFWTEVREYLDILNSNVMALETSRTDDDAGIFVERLRELNRVAHSMKGAARAVGIHEIEKLGHNMEEIFEASLKRGLALTPEICDTLYDAIDLVQTAADGDTIEPEVLNEVVGQLTAIATTNHAPPDALRDTSTQPTNPRRSDTFQAIASQTTNGAAEAKPPTTGSPQETPIVTQEIIAPRPEDDPIVNIGDSHSAPPETPSPAVMTQTLTTLMRAVDETVRVEVGKLDILMQEASELLVTRLQSEERRREIDTLRRLHGRWTKEWRAVRAAYIRLGRKLQNEETDEDLRVLMAFMEANQRYLTTAARDLNLLSHSLAGDNMRLGTLTDEIQESISSLRLVQFDTIMGSIQRTLRDAARETDKEVFLDVIGGTTEIDKSVLEHLKDPIMHLIRNAVDHGIETPDERIAVGKPPTGWVYLNVETRGSEITIHVGDDGRGIDAQKIRQTAVRMGVITETTAQTISDEEARILIFHAGLTTRKKVSAISGRGVGMDVVRDRVESLRGRIKLSSKPGEGTITTLSVPVSLTRIRSIMLKVSGERYALPALSVQRMDRLDREVIFHAQGRPVIKIGDRTVPLINLGDMLNVPVSRKPPTDHLLRVVVLSAGEREVAFEVDELISERELVLKPLGVELDNTRYVSGAALLGSGEVVIVLDANDLVRGAIGSSLPPRRTRTIMPQATTETRSGKLRVLIADDSITTRTLEKNILETAGCDVRVAVDGMQAWETLSEYPFDVVISDVEMPRMDGLALTRRIKDSENTKHIPVILLTSLSKPEQREAGLSAGADAYLVKSRFDQNELLRTIESVL